MSHAPAIIESTVPGPYDFDTDTILMGMVDGDAHVRVGSRVTIRGTVTGDLVVDHGAVAIVLGTVGGSIANGGHVSVAGVVGGSIASRKPAVAEIQSGAIVNGERIA